MTDVQAQVEHLKYTIRQQEQEIAQIEGEVAQIRRGLDEFETRYNRTVKPVSDRVDAAKAALSQLENLHYKRNHGDDRPVESLWRQQVKSPRYRYIEDEDEPLPYYSSSAAAEEDDRLPSAERGADQDELVKKIYRRLAQKYHPDKAANTAVRAIYTRLMALINTAYADKNLDALLALDSSAAADMESDLTMASMQIRNLQQKTRQLNDRIRDLRTERSRLNNSPMMDLKLKVSLARTRGKDLLKELAANLEKDYQDYITRIDSLRRTL
jgi:septal ring factor EnvC (AmiA/AmiB activator)